MSLKLHEQVSLPHPHQLYHHLDPLLHRPSQMLDHFVPNYRDHHRHHPAFDLSLHPNHHRAAHRDPTHLHYHHANLQNLTSAHPFNRPPHPSLAFSLEQ